MEFDTSPWSHRHDYAADTSAAERGTRVVLWITLLAMVVEIIAGWVYNSMALLADGWHMSSHALAIGLSVLAYGAARRYADDPRFAFGPWKIEVLGGFASAVLLLGVAALMAFASIERLLDPQPIRYREALLVAAVGLGVNLVCAWILGRSHTHGHAHDHGHGHGHENGHSHGPESATDLNLRSAYVHVLADAATSGLALIALAGGWWYGWQWLDPVMGIVGAVLVAIWARRLIIDTSRVLLDREMDHPVVEEIREAIDLAQEGAPSRVTDLHVWRVGRASYACALTVVTRDATLTAQHIRERLAIHSEVVHATIEVHCCDAPLGRSEAGADRPVNPASPGATL